MSEWIIDELDRDLHALWRFFRFLERSGRHPLDYAATSLLINDYARDPAVQMAITACPYHLIDGLAPRHRPPRRLVRRTKKGAPRWSCPPCS